MDNNRDEFNRRGLILFVFSVVFCLVFFVYVTYLHPKIDLKEIPENLPTSGAAKMDLTKIENPWVENSDLVQHGQKVYTNNCAVCHGPTGMGDGAAGAALKPAPRNLVTGGWKQGGTSEQLFVTLQNGIPGGSMASFKHLPKIDRWALVQFIRSITKDKTPDDAAKLDAFGKTAE